MTKQEAMRALLAIASAIIETVRDCPEGAPSGPLYLAMMEKGCSLEQYEQLMAGLVDAGRLRKKGHLYFAA